MVPIRIKPDNARANKNHCIPIIITLFGGQNNNKKIEQNLRTNINVLESGELDLCV